jgi:glycosyltransferase involved in cell wall biosynthesis
MRRFGKVVYVLAYFSKRSETFILREVVALRKMGVPVQVVALHRVHPGGLTPEEEACVREALFVPPLFLPQVLLANLLAFFGAPRTYLRAFRQVMGLPHRSLYFTLRALYHFLAVGYIARVLLADQPVAHLHAHFASVQTEVAMGLSVLMGVPFSFMAHSKDVYVDANALREKMMAAKFVATCTDYNARHLRAICPEIDPKRVSVVRCSVQADKIPWATPKVSCPPLILSVGRLVEKKGHLHLIEACGLLKGLGVPFQCRIIGDGPLRARLAEEIARKDLEDCVTLEGSLPYAQVEAFYHRATVFALPSLVTEDGDREGLPVVLMEALAFGVPVVSTGTSGIPELVIHEQTGLLVPPADAQSLARAMVRLMRDEALRKRLSRAGRRKVEADFDLEKNVVHLMSLFGRRAAVRQPVYPSARQA